MNLERTRLIIFTFHSSSRANSLLTLAICFFLFSGCFKKEHTETIPTAILSFGNTLLAEMPALSATQDNELIVGLSSWKDGNTELRVVSIDVKGEVKWERYLGTKQDDYLKKIYVDKKGNILVVGMSFGLADSLISRGRRDVFYFHYLSPEGHTIWEKVIAAQHGLNAQIGSDALEVREDEFGNFLISAYYGNEFLINNEWLLDFFGTLAVVSPDGDLVDLFVHGNNPYHASFLTAEGYGSFFTSAEGAGVTEFILNSPYRTPDDDSGIPFPTTTEWNWEDATLPILDVWNNSVSQGESQFVVVKSEGFILFDYNAVVKSLSGHDMNLEEIVGSSEAVAAASSDKKFLFADANGTVYTLNDSWEMIHSFDTDWEIVALAALPNGNVAVSFKKENVTNVMIYNSDGDAVD